MSSQTESIFDPENGGEPHIGSSIACFTGETLVTINDSVAIHIASVYEQRDRYIGTEIKALDDHGTIVSDVIGAVVRFTVDRYLKISFADGAWLNVTPAQRFFGEGGEFTAIAEQGEGARVLRHRDGDWRWVQVTSIDEVAVTGGVLVYGLDTQLTRNYLVEDFGVRGAIFNL